MIVTISRKENGMIRICANNPKFVEAVGTSEVEVKPYELFTHMGIITSFINNIAKEECLFEVAGEEG